MLIVVKICQSHSISFFTKISLKDECEIGLHRLTNEIPVSLGCSLETFDKHTVTFKGELAPKRPQNSRFNYLKISFSRQEARDCPQTPVSFSLLLQAFFTTACIVDQQKIGDFCSLIRRAAALFSLLLGNRFLM